MADRPYSHWLLVRRPDSGRKIMSTHIRLARSTRGPVEADWQTDAYVAERRRRIRSYNTQLAMGDDVVGKSHGAGAVRLSVAKTAATLIRDERWPGWHDKRAHDHAGGRADCSDERVIWSPFRLQSRRRSGATPAARASHPATR